MNIAEKIKNKNFKGLRIATTITSVMAHGLLIAYLIYMGVSESQNYTGFGVLFVLLSLLGAFSFGIEMNLAWGSLKRKDGTIETMKKSTLISAVVLNVAIAAFSVMCWIVELGW